MPNEYLNKIQLSNNVEGNAERIELLSNILKNDTFLPKTLEYKDIDEEFKNWVNSLEIVSDEGKKFPTMVLYSNQRFTEFSQNWEFVDENNNMLLNFKTVSRDPNPQLGKMHGDFWNIPHGRFYLLKTQEVLDDNGSESYLDLYIKFPTFIDISYNISIYTTKFSLINEFNTKINKEFSSRQKYIFPNGHPLPMTLDYIEDSNEYSIDDRQFYGQTYKIKLMGYVFTEEDFKVQERPKKIGGTFTCSPIKSKRGKVVMEEFDECDTRKNPYFFQPVEVDCEYEANCDNITEFICPINFTITNIERENVYNNFTISINNEKWDGKYPFTIEENSKVKIIANKQSKEESGKLLLYGYNPSIVLKDENI